MASAADEVYFAVALVIVVASVVVAVVAAPMLVGTEYNSACSTSRYWKYPGPEESSVGTYFLP